jgi:hypothetical protein
MPELENVTVTSVKQGPEQEGQYGPYRWVSFTISDPDWEGIKFDYIPNKSKPVLNKGQVLRFLDYKEVQRGDYTNYRIQEFKAVVKEKPKPKPQPKGQLQPQAGPSDEKLSFYVSYAKDIQIALLPFMSKKFLETVTLGELAMDVMRVGKVMRENAQNPDDVGEPLPDDEPPHDDIPY